MPFESSGIGKGSIRRGRVFTLRLEPHDEETLRKRMLEKTRRDGWQTFGRTGSLGGFIIRMALEGSVKYQPAAAAPPPAPPVVSTSSPASSPPAKALTTKLRPRAPKKTLRGLNALYGKRAAAAAKKKAPSRKKGRR